MSRPALASTAVETRAAPRASARIGSSRRRGQTACGASTEYMPAIGSLGSAVSSERMRGDTLSIGEARRIALAAQGFASQRPAGAVSARAIAAAVQRLGALQIDSVNVLVRAHYLPLFARLGSYQRERLDQLAYGGKRALFEYWGHEASLLPLELWPLFRFRMERAAKGIGT